MLSDGFSFRRFRPFPFLFVQPKRLRFAFALGIVALVVMLVSARADSTINAIDKYAHSANAGWINFRHDQPDASAGVVIGERVCSGYAYAANLGWIHFGDGSPANGTHYQNTSAADYGVNHDARGNLSGQAYGANIGWITFAWDASGEHPDRPRIDLTTGEFSGFAYGANIGWINLGTGFLKTDSLQMQDSDEDGIGDEWEITWFGDLTTATSESDSDEDDSSDLAEYLAMTNPSDARDHFDTSSHELSEDGTTLTVTFRTDLSRLYGLETSMDIREPWIDSGLGTFAPDAGTQTTRQVTFPLDTERAFLQVRVEKPLQP